VDQPSTRWRRQATLETGKTIGLVDADAAFDRRKVTLQQFDFGWVQFIQAKVITLAQHLRRDLGRAWVPVQLVFVVDRLHLIQKRLHGHGDVSFVAQGPEGVDALQRLAALGSVAAGEVVEAPTGVGVDHPEGFVFVQQVLKHLHQHHVLEHIGVVARVESVSITEHGPSVAVLWPLASSTPPHFWQSRGHSLRIQEPRKARTACRVASGSSS